MRVLLTCGPIYSHFAPMVAPVAEAIRKAGQEVAVATGPSFAGDLDRLGCPTCRCPGHRPDHVAGMRPRVAHVTTRLIDGFAENDRVDIVDDFAYPLPVAAICELLGVPVKDEPRLQQWSQAFIDTIDPSARTDEQRLHRHAEAEAELRHYLDGLADARLRRPGDDLISGLLTDAGPHGRMSRDDLLSTSVMLLITGHETTVNLITNGVLTLLRHPEVLHRLREDPDLVVPLVEELLRYEPPVQFLPNRRAVADIQISGTTIPQGSPIMLMLAAGSRDPLRFPDPDRFDPTRTDNQHLGFGYGMHYCFGAPLARAEAQIALTEVVRRLDNPRLVSDPPPYRPNPVLRGRATSSSTSTESSTARLVTSNSLLIGLLLSRAEQEHLVTSVLHR